MRLSQSGRSRGLILGAYLLFLLGLPVSIHAEPSAASSSLGRGSPDVAGRVEIGAPSGSSRAGVMKSFGVRIRSLIEPGAGMAALGALAGIAAAYGVLHALGPGHQKTLITGYLLSEGGGLKTVISAASVSAASHAASVVLLFGGLALLRGGLAVADGELARVVVTRLSALILVFLALRMVLVRIRSAYRRHGPEADAADCACSAHDGHDHHHAGGERTGDKTGLSSAFSTIIAGSLVPCPGAAFFLLYGFSAGNPAAGALAVIAISAGMWATLVAVGAIAAATRKAGLGGAKSSRASRILRSTFEIGGSVLVLGFAIALLF